MRSFEARSFSELQDCPRETAHGIRRTGRQFFRCRALRTGPGAGEHYAAVKAARQQSGLTLDENDLWLAATALGATLVSHDSDFRGIKGFAGPCAGVTVRHHNELDRAYRSVAGGLYRDQIQRNGRSL